MATEFRRETRIVVGHFVIVPDHDERKLRVCRLQVRIELVQRVTQPICSQISHGSLEPAGESTATMVASIAYSDVVAQVRHDIEVLLEHVAIRHVVAARPVLTGREGESSSLHDSSAAGAVRKWPIGLSSSPQIELIEIVASRPQSPSSTCTECANSAGAIATPLPTTLLHATICRHSPADRNRRLAQAAESAGSGASRVHRRCPPLWITRSHSRG